MNCPNCHIPVKPYYLYCPSCGTNLKEHRGGIWDTVFVLIIVVLISGGIYLLYKSDVNIRRHPINNIQETKEATEPPRILFAAPESKTQKLRLPVGNVVIEDIAGNIIAQMPAAVSSSGWVAIPEKISLGGYNWYFSFNDQAQTEIIGGIIGDYDEVGIWQLRNISRNADMDISPGDLDQPLQWMSIVSDKTQDLAPPAIQSEQQNFYRILFPQTSQEPGAFIQNNKIVGWSFGDLVDGGFIWKGTDESNLVFELTVNDFYRATFENGREEQFILGYAKEGINPLEELENFAKGFTLPAKLSSADTAERLKPEAVIPVMRSLVAKLISSGDGYNVSRIFDANTLSRAGDSGLLNDVINGIAQVNGYGNAADILDNVIHSPQNFSKNEISQIREIQKDMFKNWMNLLVDKGDYAKGFQVYNRAEDSFADDPQIHILGIKLALSFNDWKTAEGILRNHHFPIDYADQVKILEERIASLKPAQYQEDNKIVIHFAPGSNRIPVTGVLNQSINQTFIVDTGASMVTIPTEAVKKLGINIEEVPVQHLVTAGGLIIAPEITLDSIQIGGWTEKNVKAFVMDMPDQSGAGLLGLNYLHRFRMELNTQDGTLTLTPR